MKPKQIVIKQLLGKVCYSDVEKIIKTVYYKGQKFVSGPAYHHVFDELYVAPLVKVKNGEKIIINHTDTSYSVSLKMLGDKAPYAIDFTDWNYLVNVPLDVDTLSRYTPEEIVAHFMWEITFWGFTREDIEKQAKTLREKRNEVDTKET